MIGEAIRIRNFKGLLLNSRLEYHQCLIPELETKSTKKNPKSTKKPQNISEKIQQENTLDDIFPPEGSMDFQAIIKEYEGEF